MQKEWGADASYFYIAKAFVRDEIDVDILEELMMLGGLGIQYCVKTEKAYSKLSEIKEEMISVNYLEFNRRYNERDICARENMKQLINYFQWYYNISSKRVLELVPLDFIKAAYHGLHDLDLELAVKKVGGQVAV